MLLNGAAQIEETSLSFPQFALLHSVTCVQLRLITVLGNWVALRLPVSLMWPRPETSKFENNFTLFNPLGKHSPTFEPKILMAVLVCAIA
jgi:hypothetical protein